MQPDVPLWLNADIIAGPVNALSEPLDAQLFLGLCRRYFPDAVLSVGWTTRFGPDLTNFQLVPSFFFVHPSVLALPCGHPFALRHRSEEFSVSFSFKQASADIVFSFPRNEQINY